MVNSSRHLTAQILVGMIAGIGVGYLCHTAAPERAAAIADYFSIVTDLFLRLIRMIIAPLVFSTLVAGVAHMGNSTTLGRIGVRTIMWFIGASLMSLTLGIIMVQLIRPGVGVQLALPATAAGPALATGDFALKTFVTHLVPRSVFEALANNEILQIVVFSLFAGVGLGALGERGAPLVRGIEALVALMLKITGYVMRFAPLAVFAALAGIVGTRGLGILVTYGKFMGGFYLSLLVLWVLLGTAACVVLGRRGLTLFGYIREPVMLAFATATSEAAYPKTLEQLERFGIPERIASFVLPLGYSFNLDGSMMYCSFAVLFIAQAADIPLTFAQELTMLLMLMVTSKGMAGVPRASLVVIAAALPHFNLPENGLLLILGVDQFLDMGRSATNVVGNSIATAVVAKWEGVALDANAPEGLLRPV